MLAYLFWHRPYANVAASTYEAAQRAFHEALRARQCPGFRGSALYRVTSLPWLEPAGYEDWYVVEASWALDPLNSAAVTGPMAEPHTEAARHMEVGFGGLYQLLQGELRSSMESGVAWLTRPRGIQFRPALDQMGGSVDEPVSWWRRQMALGPAPEFAAVGPRGLRLSLPEGWTAVTVERTELWWAVTT